MNSVPKTFEPLNHGQPNPVLNFEPYAKVEASKAYDGISQSPAPQVVRAVRLDNIVDRTLRESRTTKTDLAGFAAIPQFKEMPIVKPI